MKRVIYTFLVLGSWLLALTGCEQRLTSDPAAHLTFSVDTLRFDTVFTDMQTPTLKFTVRNPQKEAVCIEAITLQSNDGYFQINVDGETHIANMQNIILAGKDSLYVFVKANIDKQNENNPVLVHNAIHFYLQGKHTPQAVVLEAHGQDVIVLRQHWFLRDTTYLNARKPYLVYDYMAVDTGKTLVMEAGTRIYMHDNAQIYVFGNLHVRGTLESPVCVRGDRLDDMLVDVPYDYVAGRWGSIYLVQAEEKDFTNTYDINYFEVNSGIMGIACLNTNPYRKSQLRMLNSRLHNFTLYGLYLQNTDAEIANCEISNCASYCVYLAGGDHHFTHNTVASYFTGGNIQSVSREDVAAVYVNNLSKQNAKTKAFFINNIISGVRENNVVLATPLPDLYLGKFSHNYLRADSVNGTFAGNVFYHKNDTIFRNTYFTLERGYYDFALDSVSPARGIADSTWSKLYPLDRLGHSRLADGSPDAGCYEWYSSEDSKNAQNQ